VLPPGVTARAAGSWEGAIGPVIDKANFEGPHLWSCTGNGPEAAVAGATVVTCTNDEETMPSIAGGGGTSTRGTEGLINPARLAGDPELAIAVEVPAGAREGVREGSEANEVTVAGGGAPAPVSTRVPLTVSSSLPPFGFAGADVWFSNADGTIDTQAGSHPYEATFSFDLNNERDSEGRGDIPSGREPRNLTVRLPPGLVGNPAALPQCSLAVFVAEGHCPGDTQAGILEAQVLGDSILSSYQPTPVYNLVPPVGEPAEFGFVLDGNLTYIQTAVRSGSDYGITSVTRNVTRTELVGAILTLWGEPSSSSHDPWRCTTPHTIPVCDLPASSSHAAFLTLPTACGAPQPFSLEFNSWEVPGEVAHTTVLSHDGTGTPVGFTGCESLTFGPTITTAPDTASADTPAGLTVDVKPPLGGLEDAEGIGSSDIRGTTVALPPGFVINPGQAAGLQACGAGEDGLTTEAETAEGKENNGPPSCPNASKVGIVKAKTPLLESAAEKELEGNVYVMRSNPPNLKLLAAFSADGVNIKLVLNVHLDEMTGQITTTVANVPEFPVSDFKLSFSGGAQAALDTPAQCGSYTTTSDFMPWSSPLVADVFPSSTVAITSGPGTSACPSAPLPFAPSLTAGSTTDQAGGFTDFSLLLQRGDGQQRIERLQFKEPAGLAGLISSVPLCPEPQAAAGACPTDSEIGHTVVASGPGPYPLVIPQPGEPTSPIFLTGPYRGAPFGLSILTHVLAGPFDLGTIVTRAAIAVDPRTAQITITTDPLPQIVAGVPTDLRSIDAIIDRPKFLFNPTNCNPQEFSGTAWGTPPPGAGGPGATAAVSSHFGVGSCRELGFKPNLSVTTAAKASRSTGQSLTFKIAYPKGAMGKEAWFNEAKFNIPKQLPARLSTIQQACPAATFEKERAKCPPHSVIGHAVVHTPVLPVPLAGSVYFVSYGGAAFPDAVLVLDGDNVHIELHGNTFIDKKTGVTSATFKATPDVPFESIEVVLPAGQYSEFGANLPHESYNYCGQKLVMPTFFKAQNGLEIHQNTPVTVTGCPKSKTRAQKLAAALKACRRKHGKKRAGCEITARKAYGARTGKKTHRR
jgi:hypothetical protein